MSSGNVDNLEIKVVRLLATEDALVLQLKWLFHFPYDVYWLYYALRCFFLRVNEF